MGAGLLTEIRLWQRYKITQFSLCKKTEELMRGVLVCGCSACEFSFGLVAEFRLCGVDEC